VRLKKDLSLTQQVFTVRDMGWLGFRNGALMKLIEANEFECLVTTNASLQFQQNLFKVLLPNCRLKGSHLQISKSAAASRAAPYCFKNSLTGKGDYYKK
jgi:hypothetical protein